MQTKRTCVFIRPRWLVELVGFDEADARHLVLTAENYRVLARREISDDGRFAVVGGGQAAHLNFRALSLLPVVIGTNNGAVAIVQLEHRVREPARDWD